MMGKFSFPKQARLRRERDFKRVYQTGQRLQAFPLRLYALRRDEGKSRLGLSVGRKVGKSVVRNRWKRAIREAFRLNRHRLRSPYDLVVSVSWEAAPEQVGQVDASFSKIIETLNAAQGEQ